VGYTIFHFSANSVSACQLRDGSSHQGTVTSMEENNDTFVLHSEQERVWKLLELIPFPTYCDKSKVDSFVSYEETCIS